MVSNGKNGKGGHVQWPTIGVTDNPYVSRSENGAAPARIENGAGEDQADERSRTAAAEGTEAPPRAPAPERRRRGRALFFCVAALAVVCVGLGLYLRYGGRSRVTYQIAERKAPKPAQAGGENAPVNQITSDAINQAKEELRKAGVVAEPVVLPEASGVAAPASGQASSGPAYTPYIVPETAIGAGARDGTATGRVAGQAGSETAGGTGRGGGAGSDTGQSHYRGSAAAERSIYVVTPERKASIALTSTRKEMVESRGATPAPALESVKLPPFGAMLPVRTLGVVYTFRSATLARLELTRDLSGEGWSLKRGTTLIAQNQGSVNDRAFLSLVGFVDPDTNRFVRLAGEVLGGDGGPGLKGKKRKIGGALAPVLNRVANGALAIGQAALSKGNTTIIVPGGSLSGYGSDFGLSQSAVSRREFVEVPAGAPAYVLVTDLPKEVKGVDADPTTQDEGAALTDEELAELLSKGTPEQIREALPKMPPDMRKVAELALAAK